VIEKKAKYFEEEAYEAYNNKRYTLVLFFVEQAIQLYIKSILYKYFGDFPKTHNLRILFEELCKIRDIRDFVKENEEIIDLLMTAYIEARYTDMEYSETSAKKALEFLEKFKKIVNEI
jgi:HEPN domain-containing protein